MIMQPPIHAICFDKDGTLFDYRATWDAWAGVMIDHVTEGNDTQRAALAEALEFDLGTGRIGPGSLAIAGTNQEIAEVAAQVTGRDAEELETIIVLRAASAPLQPACDLDVLITDLKTRALKLGVMTNDSQSVAEAHLKTADVYHRFDFVAGADSGYGFKPDPGPLLAFCDQVGVAPEQAVMVGDSTHDLFAGARAGMRCVGVLTGIAPEAELTPHAEVVLPHIGMLPEWLSQLG